MMLIAYSCQCRAKCIFVLYRDRMLEHTCIPHHNALTRTPKSTLDKEKKA